jgi:hypothetical protein
MSEATRQTRCQELGEVLVLSLYEELPPAERASLEAHLDTCDACRADLRASRSAIETVDSARLDAMATFRLPTWDELEDEMITSLPPVMAPARAHAFSVFAKAASIVLLAAAAFLAGRQWDGIAGAVVTAGGPARLAQPTHPLDGAGSPVASLPSEASPGERMRAFTEQTHGYFQRGRLVLLEFANTDQISGFADGTMRTASRTLLRDSAAARRVAGQIRDERIQDLVVALEEILTRIAANDSDPAERARLRVDVEDVLGRLELTAPPERLAQERSRT